MNKIVRLEILSAIILAMLATGLAVIDSIQRVDIATFNSTGVNITFQPQDYITLSPDESASGRNLTMELWDVEEFVVGVGVELDGDEMIVVDGLPTLINVSLQTTTSLRHIVVTIPLRGVRMGRGQLRVRLLLTSSMNTSDVTAHDLDTGGYEVIVTRPSLTILTKVSLILFFIGMPLNIFAFSCDLRIDHIKKNVVHPAALLVNLATQFIVMPLATFGLGAAFGLPAVVRYALLAIGCSPSGAPSNLGTLLLLGDVKLGVVIIFINNLLTILLMPLWMSTLGKWILQSEMPDYQFTIPWLMIGILVLVFTVPVPVGFLVRLVGSRNPRAIDIFGICVKVLAVSIVVIANIIMLYDYIWIFEYLSGWQNLFCSIILSIIGFFLGLPLAYFVGRQKVKRSVTIAVQAGVKNAPAAFVFLRLTIPSPESDITSSTIYGYILAVIFLLFLAVFLLHAFRLLMRVLWSSETSSSGTSSDDTSVTPGHEQDGAVVKKSAVMLDSHATIDLFVDSSVQLNTKF